MDNKITFDTGLKTYRVNDNGVLSFNPSDPNVYKRFAALGEKIDAVRDDYNRRAKDLADGAAAIGLLAEYDQRVKTELSIVFGAQNDFDAIFGGVNIMAVANDGELVITHFLDAIRPIVEEGVKTYAKMEARKSVQELRYGLGTPDRS